MISNRIDPTYTQRDGTRFYLMLQQVEFRRDANDPAAKDTAWNGFIFDQDGSCWLSMLHTERAFIYSIGWRLIEEKPILLVDDTTYKRVPIYPNDKWVEGSFDRGYALETVQQTMGLGIQWLSENIRREDAEKQAAADAQADAAAYQQALAEAEAQAIVSEETAARLDKFHNETMDLQGLSRLVPHTYMQHERRFFAFMREVVHPGSDMHDVIESVSEPLTAVNLYIFDQFGWCWFSAIHTTESFMKSLGNGILHTRHVLEAKDSTWETRPNYPPADPMVQGNFDRGYALECVQHAMGLDIHAITALIAPPVPEAKAEQRDLAKSGVAVISEEPDV